MCHHSLLLISKTDLRGRRLFVITLMFCRGATILSASQLKEMFLQVLTCGLGNQFIVCRFSTKTAKYTASKFEGFAALLLIISKSPGC